MIPATRVLLSVFLLSTIALAQSRVERNIVYGMYSGTALLMDVHYPVNANGVGVISYRAAAGLPIRRMEPPASRTARSRGSGFHP